MELDGVRPPLGVFPVAAPWPTCGWSLAGIKPRRGGRRRPGGGASAGGPGDLERARPVRALARVLETRGPRARPVSRPAALGKGCACARRIATRWRETSAVSRESSRERSLFWFLLLSRKIGDPCAPKYRWRISTPWVARVSRRPCLPPELLPPVFAPLTRISSDHRSPRGSAEPCLGVSGDVAVGE